MTQVVVNRFGGVIPRYVSNILNDNMASYAENVNLRDGSLRPFRYPEKVAKSNVECIGTLHRAGCCWMTFESPCVSIAHWLPTCQRVYVTGYKSYPVVSRITEDCTFDYLRVGLPTPNTKIEAIRQAENSIEHFKGSNRTYVFTYVNSFDEEGQPSLPSNEVVLNEGDEIELKFPEPNFHESWDVKKINIYRTASEFNDGTKATVDNGTDYFFVDQIDIKDRTYTDTISDDELGESLVSWNYMPPPENLQNITMLPDGVLAGSVGKQVWFTESYNPQAWVPDYILALDDEVIDLKFAGGNLYALTDGHPYVISSEYNEESKLRSVIRLEHAAPIVSKKSSASTAAGVIYASLDGLVNISGTSFKVLTLPWFSPEDWQAILPHQMVGGFFQGKYFGCTAKYAFLFDINEQSRSDGLQNNDLMPMTIRTTATFTDRDGKFYIAAKDEIHEWERSAKYLPYKWQSKDIDLGGLRNLAASKVILNGYAYPKNISKGVKIRFDADGRKYFERCVKTSNAFRLPGNRRFLSFRFYVEGIEPVRQIEVASSMKELSNI